MASRVLRHLGLVQKQTLYVALQQERVCVAQVIHDLDPSVL